MPKRGEPRPRWTPGQTRAFERLHSAGKVEAVSARAAGRSVDAARSKRDRMGLPRNPVDSRQATLFSLGKSSNEDIDESAAHRRGMRLATAPRRRASPQPKPLRLRMQDHTHVSRRGQQPSAALRITALSFPDAVAAMVPRLQRCALRRTRSPELADDLVGDMVVRALEREALFEPGSNLQAWLQTILHRLWINQLTKHREIALPVEDIERLSGAAEDRTDARLDAGRVALAVYRLAPYQSDALLSTMLAGVEVSDAAREQGINRSTLAVRVIRGIASLRRDMGVVQ